MYKYMDVIAEAKSSNKITLTEAETNKKPIKQPNSKRSITPNALKQYNHFHNKTGQYCHLKQDGYFNTQVPSLWPRTAGP